MSSTLIIGVGNIYRGDDGAGLAVARRLRENDLPGVTVIEQAGEGTALMEAWRNAERVALIDAVRSQARPGTIHRFDAHQGRLPTSVVYCSTHAFGLAEAVELARVLAWLPPVLIVYGIEGARYQEGTGLSPPVKHAVEQLATRIKANTGLLDR